MILFVFRSIRVYEKYFAVCPGEQHLPSPPNLNGFSDSLAAVIKSHCCDYHTDSTVGTKYRFGMFIYVPIVKS